MKKLCTSCLIIFCIFTSAAAAESPFDDQNTGGKFVDEDGSVFVDEDFQAGNPSKNPHNDKMMFLDSVQKHFWNPKRKLQDNTVNIIHRDGDTHKIRTRYAMITTIVFDNDKIAQVIFGDPQGFELKEIKNDKWDLGNILTIRPKMIGIDTNLTVIGESGTIYTFYIFSTHFTNRRDPAFTVFVSKNRSINQIAMSNIEEEEKNRKNKSKKNVYKRIEYEALEEDDGEFITIGDRVNKIHIEKAKIKRGYVQAPKATRSWKTLWLKKEESLIATRMMAIDIFNDNDYTYFKFDREDAMSKFPVLFKVVDGYDNPVNIKIVGNYIIAEDLSEKWTLKMGDEWVCVRKIDKPIIIREKYTDEDVETIHAQTPLANKPKNNQNMHKVQSNKPVAKPKHTPIPKIKESNKVIEQEKIQQRKNDENAQVILNKIESNKARLRELEAQRKADKLSNQPPKSPK